MNEEFYIPDEEFPDDQEYSYYEDSVMNQAEYELFLDTEPEPDIEEEFPDDEDAQEVDWGFKHGQY
jgi:hypothetical protein